MQQDPSEPTWPPFHRETEWDGHPVWARHRGMRRNRWHAGPLRRDPEDRILGGVAAGVAERVGLRASMVRIVLTLVALIPQGPVVPLYCIAWLLIPARDADTSIASRARHDSVGIALAAGLASLLCVLLLIVGVPHSELAAVWGFPQVITVACMALIWRNAPDSERASMRGHLERLGGAGSSMRRRTIIRLAVSFVLLAVGFGLIATSHQNFALFRPLVGGFLLMVAGIVLLLGPWWLRIARDLMLERQGRARAEERADMAAQLHDSVLQTLALIQRRANDPQQVVQLARAQERDLRSWLFEGRAPGDTVSASFTEGVRQIQRDVEARHGVPVEIVTVGDCPLDDDLGALLAAAGEATVNAAKWSGANVISVYAEVEPGQVSVAVRDRGKGFDPESVPGDRKGLAESIHGRMARHGGSATVTTAPGEGTKVTLTMPRTAASAEPAGGSHR